MTLNKVDIEKLKSDGFIKERGKDLFTVRMRVPGGRLSVDRLMRIAEVAQKYGKGHVHLSVRQSIELVNINHADFDKVVAELGEEQQKVASVGARVRVPTACGGCEYNPNGLVDTQKAALEVDEKLFGTETTHHKFKVCFAGCPIDCPKSALNDVGFQGALSPALTPDECVGCGVCAKACREGAISMDGGCVVYCPSKCVNCGDCVKSCPTGAWKVAKRGYSVRIGGKWGRHPLIGTLYATFLPEEQVIGFIKEVLDWYIEKAEGLGRIRLGDIIVREGAESLLAHLSGKFPEYTLGTTIAPQTVATQYADTTTP
ncbi:4Fe-4S binding protein [Geomonas subterranea]|uniref:4Fe-4S binding protein n=1 Tax=Geomonas subterranea TaxID=2847989 RepID=A0ABX8LPP1_9BACT|nr:4Fe-4S binding protein [Geomonas subterranea]QXE92665.1 4Fe-4S binding protein [Geomonas subterranea]QXM09236.1 4Fe-4S binding protein [Geomonas subterranea]